VSARRAAQLARLTQGAPQGGTGRQACPPELRHCLVWDWLRDDEMATVEAHGYNAMPLLSAWRRWRDARQAHAADVGMTEVQACGPFSRPTLG
jgi:hypothetical protein